MSDRLCRPENVHKWPGHVKCEDAAKIAALSKHSRKAVAAGSMVLLVNQPRPEKAKPGPKVKK